MIQIDSEFQSLIPPLTDDEYQRLEKSILSEGVREPIITWNDTIIDGHNRWNICQKHGIECPHVAREFESRDAAKIWIYGNQLGRRNLEAGQKAALVIERNEAKVREAARLRQSQAGKEHGGDKKSQYYRENRLETNRPQADIDAEPQPEKGRTAEILAKQAGVGEATIKRVLKVKRENPELYDKVRSGEVSTHTAYAQVTSNKQPKQAKANSKLTDDGKRICSYCGEPIDNGDSYKGREHLHKKCDGLQRSNTQYVNPDKTLRENVPTYTIELLLTSLEMSAKDLRNSWINSIATNESMGAKLTAHEKQRIEKAANNLLTTVQAIKEERANE